MLLVNLVGTLAALVFLRVLNSYPLAVVAYGIGVQLDMVAVMPMIGLTVGMVAMVGQNFGAGRLDRARRAAWLGGVYAAIFSGAMGIVAIIFPDFWVALFDPTHNPEIRKLSIEYIYIVGLTYAFVAQVFVLGGAFQGLGKGMPSLTITITRFVVVAIPLALILSAAMGPVGAFIAAAASHMVGGIMAIVWLAIEFRRIKRQRLLTPSTGGLDH
jgi:Na+-driven multidrug efflux pump